MIQLLSRAAAGYVLGTRAGRRRFEQIKKGYETAVNSPAAKSAVNTTRKTIAGRLDPQPRIKEVKNLRREDGSEVLEPDKD